MQRHPAPIKILLATGQLAIVAGLQACSSLYFRSLDTPPVVAASTPANWSWQSYWTGVVFNGEKIGFTHLRITPDADGYRLDSEAALRLRFLMLDKQMTFVTRDSVAADLQLGQFEYQYKVDDSQRLVSGYRDNTVLVVRVGNDQQTDELRLAIQDEIYPLSALYVYPLLHGLEVGRQYRFEVFDAETLTIRTVKQTISAWQQSELFAEQAYKLETDVAGITTTTWLDRRGLPQLELSLNGVLISALENENTAREYLAQAALNKNDALIAFSLIRPETKITRPRQTTHLETVIQGVPDDIILPETANQTCKKSGSLWQCRNQTATNKLADVTPQTLMPSIVINSQAAGIAQLAGDITRHANTSEEKITRLLAWLDKNLARQASDAFNSLDVLSQRKAECQGFSYLYAAFARQLGIPTRLLNGLVYSEQHEGFLYHTWVESFIDGQWQAIDPMFNQRHADATHIGLVYGEMAADLLPLINLIGKIEIRVQVQKTGKTFSVPASSVFHQGVN